MKQKLHRCTTKQVQYMDDHKSEGTKKGTEINKRIPVNSLSIYKP